MMRGMFWMDFWSLPSGGFGRARRVGCPGRRRWGTLGMGADRARSAPDFGSDAVDARVGDPRPRRDAFGDARRRGRPPRDAPAPRGPGVLQVRFRGETGERLASSSTGLGGGKRTGVSSEAILAPLLSVVMLVTGAAAGAAGDRGRPDRAPAGPSGASPGPAEHPKMDSSWTAWGPRRSERGGPSALRRRPVLTPRVAARRALARTISNPERGATLRRYGRTRGLICAGVGHHARSGWRQKIFSVGDGFSSRFLTAPHCTWEDQFKTRTPVSIDSGKHGLFSADQVFLGAGHNLRRLEALHTRTGGSSAGRNPRETPPAEQPE